MHHAYPPRKESKPTALIDSSARPKIPFRTYVVRVLLLVAALTLAAFFFLRGQSENVYYEEMPTGGPSVVIVTLTDTDNHNSAYLNLIRENREQYAALFGYETFIAKAVDYDTGEAPKSWAKLMAIRHAITKYPTCGHIWFLDQNALILDPKISLEALLLEESRLSEIMLSETPVVPDSIIETFGHLQAEDAALLISQDKTGLVTDSMIIKNGEWAKFFLEQWLNPLYRSYNFEKAERHALEHAVQWHPTVLSKVAIVPQDLLAPYSSEGNGEVVGNGAFVVVFEGCQKRDGLTCAQELEKFWPRWNNALGALGG